MLALQDVTCPRVLVRGKICCVASRQRMVPTGEGLQRPRR